MACRVTPAPVASCVMESGSPAHKRATSRSRVSSPKAAKTGAEPASSELNRRTDIAFDLFQLVLPASGILLEDSGAPGQRNVIETGFGDL